MRIASTLLTTLTCLLAAAPAFAGDARVLARYANYYHGDQDAFANCLVNDDASVTTLITGAVPATVQSSKATPAQMLALRQEMETLEPLQVGGAKDVLAQAGQVGAVASRVFLKQAYPGYGKVDTIGKLTEVLRSICNVD